MARRSKLRKQFPDEYGIIQDACLEALGNGQIIAINKHHSPTTDILIEPAPKIVKEAFSAVSSLLNSKGENANEKLVEIVIDFSANNNVGFTDESTRQTIYLIPNKPS